MPTRMYLRKGEKGPSKSQRRFIRISDKKIRGLLSDSSMEATAKALRRAEKGRRKALRFAKAARNRKKSLFPL